MSFFLRVKTDDSGTNKSWEAKVVFDSDGHLASERANS